MFLKLIDQLKLVVRATSNRSPPRAAPDKGAAALDTDAFLRAIETARRSGVAPNATRRAIQFLEDAQARIPDSREKTEDAVESLIALFELIGREDQLRREKGEQSPEVKQLRRRIEQQLESFGITSFRGRKDVDYFKLLLDLMRERPPGNDESSLNPAPLPLNPTNAQSSARNESTSPTHVQRRLDTARHTPWQIMQGIAALGEESLLIHDGRLIPALEYVSNDPKFRGDHWFLRDETGPYAHQFSTAYEFEGHPNQFTAWMVDGDVSVDHTLIADGRLATIRELIRYAQQTINPGKVQTWTLMLLAQTVDVDEEWTDANGRRWTIADLVRLELNQGLRGAASDGAPRLRALALARNAWRKKQGELVGDFAKADELIQKTVEQVRSSRTADGHISLNPDGIDDDGDRMKQTGQSLTWLAAALPPEELDQPWIRRAVRAANDDLLTRADAPMSVQQYFGTIRGMRAVATALNEPVLDLLEPENHVSVSPTSVVSDEVGSQSPPHSSLYESATQQGSAAARQPKTGPADSYDESLAWATKTMHDVIESVDTTQPPDEFVEEIIEKLKREEQNAPDGEHHSLEMVRAVYQLIQAHLKFSEDTAADARQMSPTRVSVEEELSKWGVRVPQNKDVDYARLFTQSIKQEIDASRGHVENSDGKYDVETASSSIEGDDRPADLLKPIHSLVEAVSIQPDENKRLDMLRRAVDEYERIFNEHRPQLIGLYARLHQGRCLLTLGEEDEARAIFQELLNVSDAGDGTKRLKDRARTYLQSSSDSGAAPE